MSSLKPTVPECNVTRRLEAWSRFHAVGMLVFTGAAGVLQNLRVLSGFIACSFVTFIVMNRGSYSPRGAFGWANGVTSLRTSLVLLMTFRLDSNLVCGLLAGSIFLLDGLDGWLARRTHCASAFGAHFDMETDAAFIAVLSQALWQRSLLGPWVLAPGLYRYLYVLFNASMAHDAPEMPRSWFGRIAYSGIALGLMSVLLLPSPFGACAAWAGTALVTSSFARSFRWIWWHRAGVRSGQAM